MLQKSNFSNNPKALKAVPAAKWMARREGIDLSRVKGSGPKGTVLVKDIENFKITMSITEVTTEREGIYASSLARKLAEKKGISLEGIKGTGTRGRIIMADVIRTADEAVIPIEEKKGGKKIFSARPFL